MRPEEAIKKLDELPDDAEISHPLADEVLLEFIRSKGYQDVAYAWEQARARIGFWYAWPTPSTS